MDDERRRSGSGRDVVASDLGVDLGIGYVSSAGATPVEKRDGYFDGYAPENTRPLPEMSMPDHMKPFMTPLKSCHTEDSVSEPVDRLGAISPASSVYSRRPTSIVTSFGDMTSRIDGNNFNPQREEYRLRKEQARHAFSQLGTYDFVEEEEAHDDWSEHKKGFEETARLETGELGQHDDYFSTQHSTANLETGGIGQHDHYFCTHHSTMNTDNRESQYEDIDLSQNDSYSGSQDDLYAEEATIKRSSGGVFGRFFGRGPGR
jgi:hypothetical protein